MQRRMFIGLGLAAAAEPAVAASRWRTIFDGRDLSAWDVRGDANWTLKDGAAEADNGRMGFLVSKETFGDHAIRAEVWVSPDRTRPGLWPCRG